MTTRDGIYKEMKREAETTHNGVEPPNLLNISIHWMENRSTLGLPRRLLHEDFLTG